MSVLVTGLAFSGDLLLLLLIFILVCYNFSHCVCYMCDVCK